MHAINQMTGGSLLALIFGLIIFVAIAWYMFGRKKR
jgi:cbb3-type cytochrome oxidase subunit 3